MLVLCPDHSAVASSVELVLNQRLLRRFCAACRGSGCAECLGTGFRGRIPAVELLKVNESLRSDLGANKLGNLAAKPSLRERAEALARDGVTSEAELARILGT